MSKANKQRLQTTVHGFVKLPVRRFFVASWDDRIFELTKPQIDSVLRFYIGRWRCTDENVVFIARWKCTNENVVYIGRWKCTDENIVYIGRWKCTYGNVVDKL